MTCFRISKLRPLIDEVIQIRICNLQCSRITLHSQNVDPAYKEAFSALSYYNVDTKTKEVDLFKARSFGGTFSGIEPMGPFWGMVHEDPSNRVFRRRKTAVEPLTYTLKAYEGLLYDHELPDTKPLCEATINRLYLADHVERIPVRTGRIRGTLFIPKTYRRCPGVLDIYGMAGGIAEFRAALLAAKGFATFAIAYYAHDDLPTHLEELDLEYFEEAIDFLQGRPEVHSTGVCVIGMSLGGAIALRLATVLPKTKVKAMISINTMPNILDIPIRYKETYVPGFKYDFDKYYEITHKGMRCSGNFDIKTLNVDHAAAIEHSEAEMLLIMGADDGFIPSNTTALLEERAARSGRNNFRAVRLPGTGHLIDPPFVPHCGSAYSKLFKNVVNYGGTMVDHAQGAVRNWEMIQEFLHEHLDAPILMARQ